MSSEGFPRPVRVSTAIEAVVVRSTGDEVSVTISNLSAEGFRLSAAGELQGGSLVYLRVPHCGDVKARILWVKGTDAGGRFLEPVTL